MWWGSAQGVWQRRRHVQGLWLLSHRLSGEAFFGCFAGGHRVHPGSAVNLLQFVQFVQQRLTQIVLVDPGWF